MMSSRWFILLAIVPLVSSFSIPSSSTHQSTSLSATTNSDESNDNDSSIHRRQFLNTAGLATAIATTASMSPTPAHAAGASNKEVLSTLLTRVRSVPTFCLVNKEGIPFMVIKQQERMAKGYAFTSMEGAIIVLQDAQKTAKEKGYYDVWESGTVVTVPGDVAVRLALQKKERIPTRGSGTPLASLVDLIPTTENRDAAIMIDKRRFQDQGKLPLFYVEGLINEEDGSMPLYLQRSSLIADWQTKKAGQALPPIQAIDMTYMFEAALRGYVDKIPNGGNVVFVPDPEQVQIADKLRKEGLTMYRFDKMVV